MVRAVKWANRLQLASKSMGVAGSKLRAMDACGAQPGFDLGCLRSAVEMQFAGEVATPSCVGAQKQPCELAELRIAIESTDGRRVGYT